MVENELTVGLKATLDEQVTGEKSAAAVGSGTLPVYATPCLAALVERTAVKCLAPYIAEGMASVGTKLELEHVSASPVGSTVSCECELCEMDRRRLTFMFTAKDGAGVIGRGKHERFIVSVERFMEKANSKLH